MKEKPTIETLINLIENGKEPQGTKDKLIESAKEFFEPLKKLYVTRNYTDFSKSCLEEKELEIVYRYSYDFKLIVEIKFSNTNTENNVAYIGLSEKDFGAPLESYSLIRISRLIEKEGRKYKINKETKENLESTKKIN